MTNQNSTEGVLKLVEIMATLRSPGGCPWDKEQTPETLKAYVLEEVYELLEAIDDGDTTDICDELGDLLLQVVFIAQIFSEQNKFGLAEVAQSICGKLIRRHPHVFAEESVDQHAQRWEEIKLQERSDRGKGHKLQDRIPTNLPALKIATKVAKKVTTENPTLQIENIQDNFSRLSRLIEEPTTSQNQFENELGEIFFKTVQLTNSLKIDAEDLLRKKTMQVMANFDL
ncbi:MAG: nucleoside triphosphate pyrophosphohydrolase [Desulfuromusa sp.]|nr:nucleoside triphosphate pyrophosphohydrolase [Desulfuromusa sp.]